MLQLDAIGSPAVVINPRRDDFPAGQVEAAREQTAWEYEHLRIADVILFSFCAEAVQPIALYALGAHAEVLLREVGGRLSTLLEGTERCAQNRARLVQALYTRLDRLTEPLPDAT
ncbi:nucleoside 2-deoxyribosyltransferase domain-containing protein [Streptomyces geranii]|uniref:nucleoside 2-deoxyribosyltransferase domain-containing protein n=1 Tax=Streptomyces geranii TaxID=2058923 RepID=UPI0018E54C80